MASLLCCGPKLAACGIVLSIWGVIMLVSLSLSLCSKSPPQRIYALYDQVSYNCFIAAGIYVLLGGFSFCQVRLNKRKEYMVR
ncbi:ribonuclease kappa [Huso huso]|uniref:Ribonuclease kappa n=1 Tax=Huso huso TaxID=61971 RepID=A0ABR0Z014_HUSHU